MRIWYSPRASLAAHHDVTPVRHGVPGREIDVKANLVDHFARTRAGCVASASNGIVIRKLSALIITASAEIN